MLDAEEARSEEEIAALTPLYYWKGGQVHLSEAAVAERALLPGAESWNREMNEWLDKEEA